MGTLIDALTTDINASQTKLALYVIGGVIVLVLVSMLIDGIKRYIRGLDTAALGALFIWLGRSMSSSTYLMSLDGAEGVLKLIYLIGGTLAVFGLLVFIIVRVFRHKRAVRKQLALEREQARHMRAPGTGEQEPAKDDEAQ